VRGGEVQELGKLAGAAVAGPAGLAGEIHAAVAGRTFKALGILGAPVRIVHDGISGAAYRAVHSAIGAPMARGAAALARRARDDAPALADSAAGAVALGALNGAWGDSLARHHGDLSLVLDLRRHGREVVTDSDGVAAAYPHASSRLAVFVHGLCETEAGWHIGARPGYGARLEEELGYTPIEVRYNTGLHVSDNGRRLAQVLEQLVLAWPVEVEQIALVGHSMGGLVSRSACHYGQASGHDWTERVRHVFCLGTPHLGAPLEKAANAIGWALGRLPETRPFAGIVNRRSAGIKDLRYGSCVEEDWCDCEPDEFLRDRCREVPFLPNAAYYFIGATLSRQAESPYGSLVGDLLVRFPSASGSGRKRRIPFEIDNGAHVGGITHFHLLNHPAVYNQIEAWLEREPAALPAPSPL
jgi:pimeloyl-ACP methyl ester carboxylesterase